MKVVLALGTNVSAQNEVDWVPRSKIEGRLRQFAEGRWADLVNESMQSALFGSQAARRKRRRQEDDDVARREGRELGVNG